SSRVIRYSIAIKGSWSVFQFGPPLEQGIQLVLQALQASQGRTGFLDRALIEGRLGRFLLQGRQLFLQRLDLTRQRFQLALLFVTELAARRRDGCRNWRRRRFGLGCRPGAGFLDTQQARRAALAQPVLIAADVFAHAPLAL